jgi:hypothetical protein
MIADAAIRGCHGYLVESPNGRIGTVADVTFAADDTTPTALVIRAGRASTRLLIIPISELTAIRPARRCVTLPESPTITTTQRG